MPAPPITNWLAETSFTRAKQPGNQPWTVTLVHLATGTVGQGVHASYVMANDLALADFHAKLDALP